MGQPVSDRIVIYCALLALLAAAATGFAGPAFAEQTPPAAAASQERFAVSREHVPGPEQAGRVAPDPAGIEEGDIPSGAPSVSKTLPEAFSVFPVRPVRPRTAKAMATPPPVSEMLASLNLAFRHVASRRFQVHSAQPVVTPPAPEAVPLRAIGETEKN